MAIVKPKDERDLEGETNPHIEIAIMGQSRILCKLEKRGKTQFAVVRRMRREAGLCLPALTAR